MVNGWKDKFICMYIIFCILKTTRHSYVNVFIYVTIKISLCHNSGITVCLHLCPCVTVANDIHCTLFYVNLTCYRPQCMEALPGILMSYWSRKWYSLKPNMFNLKPNMLECWGFFPPIFVFFFFFCSFKFINFCFLQFSWLNWFFIEYLVVLLKSAQSMQL